MLTAHVFNKWSIYCYRSFSYIQATQSLLQWKVAIMPVVVPVLYYQLLIMIMACYSSRMHRVYRKRLYQFVALHLCVLQVQYTTKLLRTFMRLYQLLPAVELHVKVLDVYKRQVHILDITSASNICRGCRRMA